MNYTPPPVALGMRREIIAGVIEQAIWILQNILTHLREGTNPESPNGIPGLDVEPPVSPSGDRQANADAFYEWVSQASREIAYAARSLLALAEGMVAL